ncbi:SgcJ/EcaC family oxidoreductase [Streptomyces sp. SID10853]|uniref:SgcJ/EcaC family oxidoreductase n=1 Tax=Streptomyces sp. SID10853 TaxID=2706028 RepID=UPI0013C1AD4F|nr:SgcJ/EcaC family oxidoreductase [Streptomyces sp. SID10853]NDZ80037.1 SgcJ/EcaC family oxidoreductase [Streptomyces sp. SID10853]
MTETSPVDELLDALVTAWNAGDAAAYADLFVEDADYITLFGQNMAGRTTIEAGHRALFEGPLKGSRLASGGTERRIRFLRPDVAVIVTGGDAPGDGTRQSVITLTAVQNDGRWRFASFQNTPVTSPPGAHS